MFYSVLFSFLPEPSRISFPGEFFCVTYIRFYLSVKESAVSYHRRKLCELDHVFKSNQASQELIRRRNIALEQGIDPLSPKYPDISDILEEPVGKSREQ